MKFVDPLSLKTQYPRHEIVFAGRQLQGGRATQEDFFLNFNNECIVIADGVGGMPSGDVAAKLATETAIWGYKHIRERPSYWLNKELLMRRIFRSVNLTLWQKRKETGFDEGLATTMSMVITSTQKIWAGSVGDSGMLLYRDGLIDILTPPDLDERGKLTNAIGLRRLGLMSHVVVERFLAQDIILLATDGVLNFVSEDQLRATFEVTGNTDDSLSIAVTHLLAMAEKNGSSDNMTACMIKKIRTAE